MIFQKKNTKEQILEQLLLENYNSYYRLAYSYVHNEADAGDIVQNGAYKVILYSDTLKHEQYAATWIYRIMLNEIFRFLKQESPVPLEEVETEQGKEDIYENIDLQRALDMLPKEDKAVIELKYFEDRKLTEIAEIMDENVNTVKSRLYRALQKLRLELLDDGRWE